MKYLEFESSKKRRFITRVDFAEYSLLTLLFSAGACAGLIVFLLFVELVERLGRILL